MSENSDIKENVIYNEDPKLMELLLNSNWAGFSMSQDNINNTKCYVNKRLAPMGYGWMPRSKIHLKNKE